MDEFPPILNPRDEEVVSRLTTSMSPDSLDLDPDADLDPLHAHTTGMMLINKLANQERALQRRRILDREPPTLYGRDDRGNVVALQGSFKRRSFSVPSAKDQRLRRQVLLQVRDKQQRTMRRVRTFMEQIEAEKGSISR